LRFAHARVCVCGLSTPQKKRLSLVCVSYRSRWSRTRCFCVLRCCILPLLRYNPDSCNPWSECTPSQMNPLFLFRYFDLASPTQHRGRL
jgi:hypothetical protein